MNNKQLYRAYGLLLIVLVLPVSLQAAPESQDALGQLIQKRQTVEKKAEEFDGLDELIRRKTQEVVANKPVDKPKQIDERKDKTLALDDDVVSEARAEDKSDIDELLSSAMGFLGVAYRFGGTTPSGFDCSGFMQYIFRKTLAVNLPRTSAEQATVGVHVERSHLQPGDMVFFRTSGKRISHVGMYVGNNRFIHAPRTGKNIEITSLSNKYWNSRYVTARRVKRLVGVKK